MPSKSAFGRALRSRQNRLRVSIPFAYQIHRLTSSLGPPFGGKSFAQCVDPTIDGRMAKFYGESLIKPVALKAATQLTAAEKKTAREAKAEALKQAERHARFDAEAAAAEENYSAERDDKLMSLEDLDFEDLTPVPLRQVPKGSDQTINPFVTSPAYAIREFVNSDKSHQVKYTLSLDEFHETKLAGVIAKIAGTSSILRNPSTGTLTVPNRPLPWSKGLINGGRSTRPC